MNSTSKLLLLPLLAVSLAAQDLVVATASGRLLTIGARTPGVVSRAVTLTGLAAGETLLGIDFRPATGDLYGLGSTSQLYRIAVATGVATAVGATLSPLLNGTAFGFDFNPTVDRIRVVSDADQDLRLHPDTGVVVAVDGTLAYAPTDPFASVNPNVTSSAYTNNFGGATTTRLYGIDSNLDMLVLQNPPNAGVLNSIGALGVNVTEISGFDIAGSNGDAYAVLATPMSPAPALFAVDLVTGAARFLAVLGTTETVVGMSVQPSPGVVPYGVATPGCFGPSAMGATGTPSIGNASFALSCVNAHPGTTGRLAIATAGVTSPIEVLGFALWVDPFSPATIWLPVSMDAIGGNVAPLPIPGSAGLRGVSLFTQYVTFDRCTRAGFAASNALALTIQP